MRGRVSLPGARRLFSREEVMAKAKRYIPEGLSTVTASVVVDGATRAIDWYKKVLGASERGRPHLGPDGKVMHAELQIGSSVIFINDAMAGAPSVVRDGRSLGGSPVALTVYVEDCDPIFKKATENGSKVTMPIGDQFWGDRWGSFTDPFGLNWSVATRKEDLTPQELETRAQGFYKQMAAQHRK
jgi:PhnB protein